MNVETLLKCSLILSRTDWHVELWCWSVHIDGYSLSHVTKDK